MISQNKSLQYIDKKVKSGYNITGKDLEVNKMMNINLIIANNIVAKMEEKRIKQIDLANEMNLPKQTISKMLNGSRMINAGELVQIAKVLDVEIVELTALPTINQGDNAIRAFMGKFESENAKNALEIADELADMIIFHAKVYDNAENMMKAWRISN